MESNGKGRRLDRLTQADLNPKVPFSKQFRAVVRPISESVTPSFVPISAFGNIFIRQIC